MQLLWQRFIPFVSATRNLLFCCGWIHWWSASQLVWLWCNGSQQQCQAQWIFLGFWSELRPWHPKAHGVVQWLEHGNAMVFRDLLWLGDLVHSSSTKSSWSGAKLRKKLKPVWILIDSWTTLGCYESNYFRKEKSTIKATCLQRVSQCALSACLFMVDVLWDSRSEYRYGGLIVDVLCSADRTSSLLNQSLLYMKPNT